MDIRRATYADKAIIFEFLQKAYSGRAEFKFPHRWTWAFENNPFLDGGQPPVWIAVAEDGRVIGQSAALVEPLILEQKEYRIGWGIDFFVFPEFRGQGIGTRLQAANNESNEIFMSLSMAEGAASIKSRLGLAAVQDVSLFTRILHHEATSVASTLRKRLPWLPFTGSIAPITARLLTRRGAPVEHPDMPAGIEIRREPTFTEAYDRLWERLSEAYAALVRRDAPYLTWKYRHQPHMHHAIFGAYWNGVLSGYMVLRRARPPERNAGIIVDLFAHPDDRELTGALLDHALAFFYAEKVTYVTVACSVPQWTDLFSAKNFKQTKTVTPLARSAVPLPMSGWLLSKGDHDWDQYPLA